MPTSVNWRMVRRARELIWWKKPPPQTILYHVLTLWAISSFPFELYMGTATTLLVTGSFICYIVRVTFRVPAVDITVVNDDIVAHFALWGRSFGWSGYLSIYRRTSIWATEASSLQCNLLWVFYWEITRRSRSRGWGEWILGIEITR